MEAEEAEARKQSHLLRDLMGVPAPIFTTPLQPLPPTVLTWNDHTIPRLAEAIYEKRRLPEGTLEPARLAVLADALEEAGCQDQDVLGHCRSGGEHVRGCWVIDLLLGKS